MSDHRIKYRPEIDGLRAVAVVPVIFFHAGIATFSGGFIGVDIFFVISGYLITSIILAELETGRFSILKFYERRARRILPALAVVIVAFSIAGWFLLQPDELKTFGQSVVSVATFTSNYFFYKRVDYFQPAAELNPLLHTWSLAVEEQFYLFFPVLLLACWKFTRERAAVAVLALLSVLSLAAAEYGWRNAPIANFFLLPFRAWELFFGALCAFPAASALAAKCSNRFRSAIAWGGLFLIVASVFAFDHGTPSPSLIIAIPVVGAVCIILFAAQERGAGRLLAARPFVWLGLMSYSAYLWHQPLFAFFRLAVAADTGYQIGYELIGAVFILAFITYRWVERPFRRQRLRIARTPALWSASLSTLVIAGVLGLSAHFNQGFPSRVSSGFDAERWESLLEINYGLSSQCEYQENNFKVIDECVSGAEPHVLLWGDSFAMHLAQGLVASDVPFVQATKSVCGPSFFDAPLPERAPYFEPWARNCFEFDQSILEWLKAHKNITHVVLGSPFKQFLAGRLWNPERGGYEASYQERLATIGRTIQMLKSMNIVPILVLPPPANGQHIGNCLKRKHSGLFSLATFRGGSCDFKLAESDTPIRRFLMEVASTYEVTLIDLPTYMCPDGQCRTEFEQQPIYRDGGHLSKAGSRLLEQRFHYFESMLHPM
ncbi:MAG: acyltransferase [Variovorax sp.]|nr:acyltransferase [Variovorax sp.]